MSTQTMKSKTSTEPAGELPMAAEDVVDRLAGLLPADELQDALKGLGPEEITGSGGFLSLLAGRVIETALGAELTEHLGCPPGQAPLMAPGIIAMGRPRRRFRASSARSL